MSALHQAPWGRIHLRPPYTADFYASTRYIDPNRQKKETQVESTVHRTRRNKHLYPFSNARLSTNRRCYEMKAARLVLTKWKHFIGSGNARQCIIKLHGKSTLKCVSRRNDKITSAHSHSRRGRIESKLFVCHSTSTHYFPIPRACETTLMSF